MIKKGDSRIMGYQAPFPTYRMFIYIYIINKQGFSCLGLASYISRYCIITFRNDI